MSYFCRQNVSQISLEIVANCSHPSEILALGIVNRSIIIKFLRERGVLAMAPHRLRNYKYAHFLRCFKIRRLLFDCSFSFSFTPIDRLWHDACSLDSMERNAYIRACELSQPWIQFDVLIKLRN